MKLFTASIKAGITKPILFTTSFGVVAMSIKRGKIKIKSDSARDMCVENTNKSEKDERMWRSVFRRAKPKS